MSFARRSVASNLSKRKLKQRSRFLRIYAVLAQYMCCARLCLSCARCACAALDRSRDCPTPSACFATDLDTQPSCQTKDLRLRINICLLLAFCLGFKLIRIFICHQHPEITLLQSSLYQTLVSAFLCLMILI